MPLRTGHPDMRGFRLQADYLVLVTIGQYIGSRHDSGLIRAQCTPAIDRSPRLRVIPWRYD